MAGFQHDVAGGSGNLVATQIQSPNFVHGVSGWRIAKDGTAEFHSILIPSGSGGATVYFASTAPVGANTGDLWYNTANGLELSQWNGAAWSAFQIGTGAIASQAITTGLIANNAVTAAQVANATITGTQLNASVTARSLGGVTTTISGTAPSSPLTGDLWVNSSSGYQLEQYNGSAWTAISWNAADVITAGSIGATLLSGSITARSLGGITTTIAGTAPGSPTAGDIWLNSANGYQINQYSGSAWVAVQWTATDVISAGTISASLITAATITGSLIAAGTITAGNIAANTITATQIAAGTITASQIAAGTITGAKIAGGTITASNIAANTITASQLAAGIIYAGIVDSTTVNAATFTGSTFQGTNFILNSSGAFFYSGTPAAGNLIESITNAAGTDGFGNAYLKGNTYYANDGDGTFIQENAGLLIFGNSTYPTVVAGAAAANLQPSGALLIHSGTTASGFQINQDGTVQMLYGSPLVASQSNSSEEVWHSLGTLSGTGSANLTVNQGRYRLTPDGECEIDISLTATAATTAGTSILWSATLPAAYRYTGNVRSYPVGFNGTVTTATNTATLRVAGTTNGSPGVVSLQLPSVPNTTNITVTQRIPLN